MQCILGGISMTDTQVALKRSTDESAYKEFAKKMVSKIALKNTSESIDVLIEEFKKSEYCDKV